MYLFAKERRPWARSRTSLTACSILMLTRMRSPRLLRTISLICASSHAWSQRPSHRHTCMTSCRMLPHTSDGVTSTELRTRFVTIGFRRHCGAVESAVAVMSRSGCWMKRFDWVLIVIVGTGGALDVDAGAVKSPSTLMTSPTKRGQQWGQIYRDMRRTRTNVCINPVILENDATALLSGYHLYSKNLAYLESIAVVIALKRECTPSASNLSRDSQRHL